ncbi:MAG: AAA family ATPase [Blastocatellia bacterium]|nr:AAA family ATPase [Blastocatellia bacterium]
MTKHISDRDDDVKKFDEDAYFRKLGLTKAEKTSKDKWDIVRRKIDAGHAPLPEHNLFDARPANDWMKRVDEPQPETRRLFGDFWLEGELAILFADTGLGKSILAVQITESLARGRPIKPFEMEWKAAPTADPTEWQTTPVLYIDFELSREQFGRRYSGVATKDGAKFTRRRFHKNSVRAEMRPYDEVPPAFKTFGDLVIHSIRCELRRTEAAILIIDNISWLRTANINASAARDLMSELKALKSKENLSILVLAHTPKRPFARPLTVNDLAGSKMLANFADSIFAIGDSVQGSNIRYLKQIKPRSTKPIYDASNVAVARIEKPSNFLKFTFTGFASEAEHLIRSHFRLSLPHSDGAAEVRSVSRPVSAAEAELMEAERFRKNLIANTRELRDKGLTFREIGERLGIGTTTVRRYLSEPPA